jgi:NTP pyrophosphatase (non-canonical NTP hydrolase)
MIMKLRNRLQKHCRWGPLKDVERVRFMALALCGEAGELANLVKKDWRGDAGDRRDQMVEELADVANYAFMLAELLDVDLIEAMSQKLIKVEKRQEFMRHVEGKIK